MACCYANALGGILENGLFGAIIVVWTKACIPCTVRVSRLRVISFTGIVPKYGRAFFEA